MVAGPGWLRSAVAVIAAWLLAWPAARYIRMQRDRLQAGADALPLRAVEELSAYFPLEVLYGTRIVVREDLRLPLFPFQRALEPLGLRMPDPGFIAAITLLDLVAVREEAWSPGLLFHELVHAVQYRLLGLTTFARLYVQGFLESGGYETIPLEQCAFTLEERFQDGGPPFNVETAVAEWLASRGYLTTRRTGPNSPDSTGS